MTLLEFLENKNIVILGFGKQGKSTYRYIRKHFPNKKITIADRNEDLDKNELDENINFNLGKDYLKDLDKYDLIIKAPGVVLKDIDTTSFEDRIITDYELFLKYGNGTKIGITGTKGKSTTSTVLYQVLKEQGKDAYLLGNIGKPILDEIDNITSESVIVLEVSSHTLEFVKTSPEISILLDVYPEHLDHCNGLEDYVKAKFNIAKYQDVGNYFIYNAQNEIMKEYNFNYKENDIAICINDENLNVKNKVYLKENNIYFNNKLLMDSNEPRKIQGMHMLNNMMFILAVSEILNLDLDKTVQTLKNAEPLEHRMEYVGKYDDIIFYNDAIATIPEATINCIKTLENVDTLICGGMDRGVRPDLLIAFLKESNVKNIICMPETGYVIHDYLKDLKNVYKTEKIEEAVLIAKKVTQKGKICVLSPAASSYNSFKNFEEKGNLYKKCVKDNII